MKWLVAKICLVFSHEVAPNFTCSNCRISLISWNDRLGKQTYTGLQVVTEKNIHFCLQNCEKNKMIGSQRLLYWSGTKGMPTFMKVGENNLGWFSSTLFAYCSFLSLHNWPRLSCSDIKRTKCTVQGHSMFLNFNKGKLVKNT